MFRPSSHNLVNIGAITAADYHYIITTTITS